MHKTVFFLTLITLFSNYSFSQKKIEPSSEDKYTAKALKEKYPDDSVVLLKSEDYITFDFNKKEDKVAVNQESTESMINIDSRSNIQKYCFYDGQSIIDKFEIKNKNNKKASIYVKDEAYTSEDLFHNDTRVKYANISFPLLGYKFKTYISKEYHDIKYFTKLYFNDDYPVVKKIIKIEVPNWLELELREINFEGYSIKKNITKDPKKGSKTYIFTLENIPSFYKENSTPGPTYIYPHILVLAKSHTFNEEKKHIFNSTQDLYDWYKSLVNTLENDNTSIKDKVKSLTENAKNDEEKIKNIYYWVQDNIRYIAFEDGIAGFKPDEASNVFNKKYGDCKGMANLTKQMLIEAGFDARLTWLGTKRIAYDYSTPNLSVDNHMICSLFKDGKIFFLDGTEKFNAYGEYADRIQGKQVLIENGDDFILKTVPEVTANFNKEIFSYNLSLNNDTLEGTVSKNFNGESRTGLLYSFDTLKNDKKEEFLEYYLNNGNTNIKISDIETTDLLNRELNLNISYNISVKNAVSSFDDDIYIDIDFDKELENFQLEKRNTDYVFSFKRSLETTTSLKIPPGYSITQIPKDISISSKNYDMYVTVTKTNNVITYKKSFKIKNAKIETSDFKEWNEFISKLKSVYNEQIVLTKQ
ncbi:transglutaminase-like domain-containing protein [Sabulilitoribacter arenilitoris]|uniref:Transglutaminase-like domain-containing protein n=1 Tax=Wocania arenilitoris TaxID=2044858 RepID=A0AAE3EMM9_9FLAO|nr:transglutaminase-like domain-containing protein [Wocania arenilitoris]MCF7568201.1 transglutaminase-like domain-containing protein [Wocania arenilitoris]